MWEGKVSPPTASSDASRSAVLVRSSTSQLIRDISIMVCTFLAPLRYGYFFAVVTFVIDHVHHGFSCIEAEYRGRLGWRYLVFFESVPVGLYNIGGGITVVLIVIKLAGCDVADR